MRGSEVHERRAAERQAQSLLIFARFRRHAPCPTKAITDLTSDFRTCINHSVRNILENQRSLNPVQIGFIRCDIWVDRHISTRVLERSGCGADPFVNL